VYGKELSLKKKRGDGSNVLIKEESAAAVHVVTSQGVGRFLDLYKVMGYSFCQQKKM